ncbi:MAG: 50S ribosomal protein L21 [Candidatus Tagabacteria bacterium RIFCSPLOWO2_01_FULL_42_9]|uniref:Large ribosomal subunit protein bL21 n=1 Tax=Candidatus Tagabacteria bacterium RIFCSPLOWO2_01_FULL_42_9 TaxID=1802296 RepID=A0A1G2LX27_9BACT|nr:MAG: 50S ribosomal protein L21 [Candidatus Tagabacteria bacterium RIFCSPLOWO2_01_FULL_42_9]
MTAKNEKFAVIETGGKQYLVKPGSVVRVERIGKPGKGDTVHFDKVLLSADKDKIKLGNPYLKDAKISGKWVKEMKGKKITHLRYRSKTRHAVKKGHRQIFTEVVIGDFN